MKKYSNLNILKSRTGIRYRTNPIYPTIPPSADDYYIMTSVADRYDKLAKEFYGDSSLWWIIASANNNERASLIVEPGVQLRIPSDPEYAISLYNSINSNR